MHLGRRYLMCVFGLVGLSVLGYGVSDDDLGPFLLSVPVMVMAWVVNGANGGRSLPRWVLNLLLAGATVHMALNWPASSGETIGAICRYLIWLQLIKLFEAHSPRDQGQLILLTAMLTVGSCLTSVGPELGAVLLVYLPLLMWTVMLFQVWSGHWHASGGTGGGSGLGGALGGVRLTRGGLGDVRRIGWGMGLAILALACAVFVGMPRGLMGQGMSAWAAGSSRSVTGFADHVQLGSEGFLSDSRTPVMLVRIEGNDGVESGGRVFRLRGAVLDEYDGRAKLWRRSKEVIAGDEARLASPELGQEFDESEPWYRVNVEVLGGGSEEQLFSVWRAVEVAFTFEWGRTPRYFWNSHDGMVMLTADARVRGYSVLCLPRSEGSESPLVRPGAVSSSEQATGLTLGTSGGRVPGPRARVMKVFTEGPVRELAERILVESRVDIASDERDGRRRAASAFAQWLRKNCVYTREMTAPELGSDPHEMFLLDEVRGRRGHCEYFASGMAALCMSVGVPARVVTGYVAAEFDDRLGAYLIRESDAHAWTEVEVRAGLWEEFDPSPAELTGWQDAGIHPVSALFRRALDVFELAWIRSIASFDSASREGALGRAAGLSPMRAIKSVNDWLTRRLENDAEAAEGDENRIVWRFFSYVLVGGALAVTGAYLLVTRAGRWLSRRGSGGEIAGEWFAERPLARELEGCFRTMLSRLSRAGVAKPEWLPAGAHARALGEGRGELSREAGRIAEMYYAARFGGAEVTKDVVREARRCLERMAIGNGERGGAREMDSPADPRT